MSAQLLGEARLHAKDSDLIFEDRFSALKNALRDVDANRLHSEDFRGGRRANSDCCADTLPGHRGFSTEAWSTGVAANLAELHTQTRSAQHGATDLGRLLALRVPPLRAEAGDIANELGRLGADAARQAAAADRFVGALHDRAEALRSRLSAGRDEDARRAEALAHRQATLEEEVRVLERRSQFALLDSAPANGSAWAAAEAERREALEARIAEAERRKVSAAELGHERARQCEERLVALRDQRLEVERRVATLEAGVQPGSGGPTPWRARLEAFVAAQNALADRAVPASPDHGWERIDRALSAAEAGACQTDSTRDVSAPEYLAGAVRCLRGLAEGERRRGALLAERWRELQGDNPGSLAMGSGSLIPGDRSFSPSPENDWDLDLCRAASRGGGVGSDHVRSRAFAHGINCDTAEARAADVAGFARVGADRGGCSGG